MNKNPRQINPRIAWNNEAVNFTPWLAENLGLLGAAIDIDLEQPEKEKVVGRFRADLVVCASSTDNKVIIENQYGKSDHDHLGKCLTYAANLGIETVIWMAQEFTPEHINTVKRINDMGFLHMYAVEFSMQQAGITFTLQFTVVASPIGAKVNGWTKFAALARLNANTLAQEAMKIEPRLQAIIEEAIQQENTVGYENISRYYTLKQQVSRYVGRYATYASQESTGNKEWGTSTYYDAIMDAIIDLLPPDDMELYKGHFQDMPAERVQAWKELDPQKYEDLEHWSESDNWTEKQWEEWNTNTTK